MFKIKNDFDLNRNLNNSDFINNNNNKIFASKLNSISKGILYKNNNIFNNNNFNKTGYKKSSSQPKLFSLLDINDKITNSETTD